jgi:hypothetical protein
MGWIPSIFQFCVALIPLLHGHQGGGEPHVSPWNFGIISELGKEDSTPRINNKTGYGLDERGTAVRFPTGTRYFSPQRQERLWGLLRFQWVPGLLPWGQRVRGVELTTQSSSEIKNCGAIPSLPLRLHFRVLNFLITQGQLCRSQRSLGLRHEPSSPARKLESWVPIPLEAWLSVCVYSMFVLFYV